MKEPTPSSAAGEFKSDFPAQFTVLGVKLLPLSLGRYRLMKYAELAFVSESETNATVEDLFTGIVICGMTVKGFQDLITTGKLEKALSKWTKKLRKQIRKEAGFNILQKISLFARYIQEGQKLPWVAMEIQSDNATPTNTHWSTNVEIILRGQIGWSRQEIDEEPLTKALADYFKHMENEGCVRLMPHNLYGQMMEEGIANAKVLERMVGCGA